MADLEKLLKTKIELEAVEYPEDVPNIRTQGRINDGRRMYAASEDKEAGAGEAPRRSSPSANRSTNGRDRMESFEPRGERGGRRNASSASPSYTPRQAPRDPFFDKPYEAPSPVADAAAGTATTPSWEAAAKANPARAGKSANIRSKKRVAALFKAVLPSSEPFSEPVIGTTAVDGAVLATVNEAAVELN